MPLVPFSRIVCELEEVLSDAFLNMFFSKEVLSFSEKLKYHFFSGYSYFLNKNVRRYIMFARC